MFLDFLSKRYLVEPLELSSNDGMNKKDPNLSQRDRMAKSRYVFFPLLIGWECNSNWAVTSYLFPAVIPFWYQYSLDNLSSSFPLLRNIINATLKASSSNGELIEKFTVFIAKRVIIRILHRLLQANTTANTEPSPGYFVTHASTRWITPIVIKSSLKAFSPELLLSFEKNDGAEVELMRL